MGNDRIKYLPSLKKIESEKKKILKERQTSSGTKDSLDSYNAIKIYNPIIYKPVTPASYSQVVYET